MAIFEFHCQSCNSRFEQITSSTDPDYGKCPKCQGKKTEKLVSRFAVGGQGDLRESTLHGCHDANVPLRGADSGSGNQSGGGHTCGGGCSH